jgi:predicted methyltransferase
MGILINNMKIIHTSTFTCTIIHTNFNHYLETTQRKQREKIIQRKESVSHKEDTRPIYEYIYYRIHILKSQ